MPLQEGSGYLRDPRENYCKEEEWSEAISKMEGVLRVQWHGGTGDHSDRNLSRGTVQGVEWEEGRLEMHRLLENLV